MVHIQFGFQVKDKIPLFRKILLWRMRQKLEQFGRLFVATAREKAPVRTGRLRQSINYRIEWDRMKHQFILRIGSDLPYAKYVELGTRCMRARPFLTPTYIQLKPLFFAMFKLR